MNSAFRMRLPATSANLGAAFDSAAVALGLHLDVQAVAADRFSITATGRNADQCSRVDGNLILDTYTALLRRESRDVVPLAIRMHNEISLGMGCGSSAAGRLAAIAMAVHFGNLGWSSERLLAEACALEGHPDNAAACWLGGFVAAACEGDRVHVARVEPPASWRAIVVMPGAPLATSQAREVLPAAYSRADVVANIQAAALLGLAFAQGRADLLRASMTDRIHQPYRAAICPLLPQLLPLAGQGGVLGVALSGAGPSVLVIYENGQDLADAEEVTLAIQNALGEEQNIEILAVDFEICGGMNQATELSLGGPSLSNTKYVTGGSKHGS